MAKKKQGGLIDLPPSGVQMGVSTGRPPQEKKIWRTIFIGTVGTLIGMGIVGSILPDTPEQINRTQTASAALVASDVPINTATDSPTNTPTVTSYPDITMTATTPATFEEEEASLRELPAVTDVERIERQNTDYWAIVTTWPKMNKESFAGLIQTQAMKVDIYTFRFAVRIDDGESEPLWWIYDDQTFEWSSSSEPPEWVDMSTAQSLPSTSPSATAQPVVVPTVAASPTDESQVQSTGKKTYYATSGSTNVRSCPKTSCSIVTKIGAGDSIVSDGYASGDAVNAGNAIWYRVSVDGKEAYVYSGIVSATRPMAVSNNPTNNAGSGGGNGSTGGNSSNVAVPQTVAPAQVWDCSGDIYNCGSFSNRSQMNAYFATCPGDPSNIDGDGDGSYCE